MAITDDLRKTLTDPTPLYFAAGTADLAVRQARKVPALIEQLRAEAPERIEAVRNADPKVVQERVTTQAKEAQATVQAKVTGVIGAFDTDLKKLGESAQDLALRGVGMAAEYAVRARETYEKVAEHGEQTVRAWRGETADEIVEIATVVESGPGATTEPTWAPEAVSETGSGSVGAGQSVPRPAGEPETITVAETETEAEAGPRSEPEPGSEATSATGPADERAGAWETGASETGASEPGASETVPSGEPAGADEAAAAGIKPSGGRKTTAPRKPVKKVSPPADK
ncbi:hypothetical protein ACPXCE_26100 [Streptomyces sp. DT24]|uniref:hypothetical protein n=1 Tax=Streptomyces sp. DT24 TaxID=3416520 RepID=UPI003CEF1120